MTVRTRTLDQQTLIKNLNMSGSSAIGYKITKTQNGANSPGFPDVLTENAYTVTIDERYIPRITTQWVDYPYSRIAGCFAYSGTDGTSKSLVWTPESEYALMGRIVDQVRGHDFNLGVALGEAHTTARMIGDTAITIARAIRDVKRGNLVSAAKRLGLRKAPKHTSPKKTAANNWLEYQYGWMPLLSDVHSGAEALAHNLRPAYKMRYKARFTQRDPAEFYSTAHPWNYRINNYIAKQYIYEMTESSVPTLPQNLGLADPEVVAWELVPFSFVLDWFLPIGDYLSLRAESSRLTGKWITSTKTYKHSQFQSAGNCVITDPTTARSTYHRLITFTRSVSGTPPKMPLPRIKPLTESFSVKRIFSGLALLTQVFGK